MIPGWATQPGYDVRAAWGRAGLEALVTGGVQTIVVVDVLRWSSAVDVACSRGALVVPFPWSDEDDAAREAERRGGAVVATRRAPGGDTSVPSLSPVSLRLLEAGTVLVLPSPNGSSLAVEAASCGAVVIAGCLRNASAVAAAIDRFPVGLVAAGESWPDGTLRPCLEDGRGAGAIAMALAQAGKTLSPEAEGLSMAGDVMQCASARELQERGWGLDVEVAAAVDVSRTVPVMDKDGAFRGR